MISLDVEPYCDNCPNFEARVYQLKSNNFFGGFECETYVRCEHRERCMSIRRYLEEEMIKTNGGDKK